MHLVTLPPLEELIFEYRRLLESSPRPNPHRPTLLRRLGTLLCYRGVLSCKKGDFDRTITYLTEAVLLPFQPNQDLIHTFFLLATCLLSRLLLDKQPEDIKSSVKYFRFLRINFHPLETADIPHGALTARLFQALTLSLGYQCGDMRPDLEEMVALMPEVLASDVSTVDASEAIGTFAAIVASTETFRRRDTQQVSERLIQILREATVLRPDSIDISHALASCLAVRFEKAHVINDYEEAIAIADKIVAAYSPGDSLTPTQRHAIILINALLSSRINSYSRPEYLEDTIQRIRTLLTLPSLPDKDRACLAYNLNTYTQLRPRFFGITGYSDENKINAFFIVSPALHQWKLIPEDDPRSQTLKALEYLQGILSTFENDKTTDIEALVELGRNSLPQHWKSSQRWSFLLALHFALILSHAHLQTKRLDYLNEAITTFRDLRKVSAPKVIHFEAGEWLLIFVHQRYGFLHLRQDLEEFMQLFPELANDGSAVAVRRFKISCFWALCARLHAHRSVVSTAYETALSLLQQTLIFSPTLQAQHFSLARMLKEWGSLPSDYASYQIKTGQPKQAIETLERGRALLWSEMRGLRTSTDQIRAANPALGDKLADINQRLESVTMSVAQSENEIGDSETEIGLREGMDSIGRLVTTQRRLLEERETLISHIQSLPGFENFLEPPSFDVLNSAAVHGPVIIINQSRFPSYIILLLKNSPPSVISTPSKFHDRAKQLKKDLLRARKEKGLDSKNYDLALTSVLADLYELVGKPVIKRLHQLEVPEKSRVWWCPTGTFCSLPLHAMGPIPSDEGNELYFSDLYTSSYTPTLFALIESRKPGSLSKTFDDLKPKPSLLLVAQPDTLPGAWGEIGVIQTTNTPVTTLVSAMAMPKTVVERLRDHQFAHFVCHGLLETGKPFDASFELHRDNLTLLDIVRSQLPAAEFAFLSACHTAELTEESVDDEGLHLAAAMQFCGFRSVVGTMWAMADTDGADLSKYFYKAIFSDKAGQNEGPYYKRSARALQIAVNKLRRKRGITLERWVNFVHYGA